MRNISDTIARLAALRAQHAVHSPAQAAPGRLATLSEFGANPGALAARFYVPADLPAGAPLVVVLHGCTQAADAYDHSAGWSRLADRNGFALLYPEQQRGNNPNLCFNWFVPGDIARHGGEALSIRNMIERMVATHGLDRSRIFVTGLSAGGAMAGVMLATYPEVFAGGAIIAGLPYGTATTVPEAFDRMRGHGGPAARDLQRLLGDASPHDGPWPRISIWHGTADQTVAPANAEAIAAQWLGAHRLDAAPVPASGSGERRTKRVWHDADGQPAIEVNMIAGMGHGTPLGDGLGTPAPFMLDVGISSTLEIARFWGIAEEKTGTTRALQPVPTASAPVPRAAPVPDTPARTPPPRPASEPASDEPAPHPGGVKKIIEDALRAAGLMR